MPDVLAAWKARSRKDVTLPSGTKITIRLPDIQDLIALGEIPLPVLAKMQRLEKDPDAITLEDMAATQTFHRQLIQHTVVAVEGEPVVLVEADIKELPIADRDAIVAYALRTNGAAPKR